MRSLTLSLTLTLVILVAALPGAAQEAPPTEPEAVVTEPEAVVVDQGSDEATGVSTAVEPLVFPAYCRLKVDAIFWGARQWFELAQGFGEDLSQCAEYHITIPPQDDNRRNLRAAERFDEVRLVDPRVHPIAEIQFTVLNRPDWRDLAIANGGDLDDFYNAGVLARVRMAQGTPPRIDIGRGETWAFNELTEEVLQDLPGWRDQVLAFMRGLHDGPPGAPKAKGIVFNLFRPSTAGALELASYKEDLKRWLGDEAFWRELDTYADFFVQESYLDVRNWGVEGVPVARRAASMNDYFNHVIELAEAGPESVEVARTFLRRTYLPLGNAAWPSAGIGSTDLIPAETVGHFLSAQMYAFRHYANAHPQGAPQGRLGFGWAPIQEHPEYSPVGRDLILHRLANAIHESSEEGTNSQMGACRDPQERFWCAGVVEGAALTDVWGVFSGWD
jgi:hypothetical protein